MFATFRSFRRQIAVLAALSLLASVLVAVPAVAADPEPSYEATFDACGDAPSAAFTDVPSGHANASDIDCIAYYGITKGTSATTYAPNMSVTREHMALFLIRLAGLVGIDIPDAGDTGFTDTDDLSANSQAAISQLRQLGITQGTSDTTYSPADSVKRGNMALFIARVMNLMTPLTDGDPSLDDTAFYGYTPEMVDANEKVTVKNQDDEDEEPEIDSPFTDLGPVSKNQYDAITQLYELGVASGVSDTAFAPSAVMTRAAMAGFMAAMLDHSNARPAGVSIQADKTSGYGEYVATVLVSVRNDEFGAMSDQLVDIFQNNCEDSCGDAAHFETSGDDAGQCNGKQSQGDCEWNTDDHQTDGNGNIFYGADIGATPAIESTGKVHTVYAWIGAETGDEFNVDEDDYASVSAEFTPARDRVKATTSINKEAAAGQTRSADGEPMAGQQVNLGSTRSVVVTGQLVDGPDDDAKDVKQGGVEVTVGLTRTVYDRAGAADDAPATDADTSAVTYENTDEATRTTNDDGTVTFVVDAPRNIKSDKNQDVIDVVTFTVEADNDVDGTVNTMGMTSFNWVEDTRTYQKTTASATEYVIVEGTNIDNHDVSISVSARLFDQYGTGIRVDENGNAYRITLTLAQDGHMTDIDPNTTGIQRGDVVKTPTISSSSSRRGMARALFAVNNVDADKHNFAISYQIADVNVDADGDVDPDVDGNPVYADVDVPDDADAGVTGDATENPDGLTYVYVAAQHDDDVGEAAVIVDQTFGEDKKKKIPASHFATAGEASVHGVLYAMDNNDTYIVNGETAADCVTIRPKAGNPGDMVRIVIYYEDDDKSSIFDITPQEQESN